MELSAKVKKEIAVAEEGGIKVEISKVTDSTTSILFRDPSVSQGWVHVVQSYSEYTKRFTHHAAVAYTLGGEPRDIPVKHVRLILREFIASK